MPLMSWAFECDGRPVRAEIGWHPSGRTRKRLYVDHRCAAARRGRFNWGRPLTGVVGPHSVMLDVRFKPKWFGTRMTCSARLGGRPVILGPGEVRVESRRRFRDDQGERHGSSLDFVIVLAILLVLCMAYGPLIAVALAMAAWSDRWRRAGFRRRGRLLSWTDMLGRSRTTPGTLILQFGNLSPTRAWWTPDDVAARWALPRPDWLLISLPSGASHPFIDWCAARYLSRDCPVTFRVDLPASERLRFREDEPLQGWGSQPHAPRVVLTGYATEPGRIAAAKQFDAVVSQDADRRTAALIAGADDASAGVRALCRETLRLIGPGADAAVHALTWQLERGPWAERYEAARTLVTLGPAGVASVERAADLGDPEIRDPAAAALH